MTQMLKKLCGGCKPPPANERFRRSYVVDKLTGCWIWQGRKRGSNGYGSIKVGLRSVPAHRFSWELANGSIPDGQFVLHSCDTPLCVNPAHLFLGTHQDNSDDKVRKGRQSRGESHSQAGAKNRARGERGGMAKLTESQVQAIRRDKRSQRAIAKEFGITQTLVWAVKNRKVWNHI